MKVLEGNNPHCLLPVAMRHILNFGVRRSSRNGDVLQAPEPVATVYLNPRERVVLWPERDANPFFHLYEALWMLAGRNDVAGPTKYVKSFAQYSDDGTTFHGAYGDRWRNAFQRTVAQDQLHVIAKELRANPDSRRCVLQMWDSEYDLGRDGKDLPCNLTVTFQVNPVNKNLDMTVFNRSNDIIWGCYGANAVHFSYLHEYMAIATGIHMGRYTQISVNWHAYDNELLQRVSPLQDHMKVDDPYWSMVPMWMANIHPEGQESTLQRLDDTIEAILYAADNEKDWDKVPSTGWTDMVVAVLRAHEAYRAGGKRRIQNALYFLPRGNTRDWIVAARQWLERRLHREEYRG